MSVLDHHCSECFWCKPKETHQIEADAECRVNPPAYHGGNAVGLRTYEPVKTTNPSCGQFRNTPPA